MKARLSFIWLPTICVLLVTLILSVDTNYRAYVDDLRQQQSLNIYLHSTTTPAQLTSLIKRVKSLPGYQEFKLEDQQVAFDRMQSLLGGQLLPDSSLNPFPRRLAITFAPAFATVENFQRAAPFLQQSSGVDTVTYNGAWMAAQEQAFARWQTIIVATLLLSAIALLAALITGINHAEERSRILLQALQAHGAGLRSLVRRFILGWSGLAIVSTLVGIGSAYLIWYLVRTTFTSSLFVNLQSLAVVVVASLLLTIVGLYAKSLRYR